MIQDNLDPMFYEALQTNYDMPEPPSEADKDFDCNNAPPIVLNLYDKDYNIL